MHLQRMLEFSKVVQHSGQAIQGVFPTAGDKFELFFYTIGNASRGLPELMVIGRLRNDTAMLLLNTLGAIMREKGKAFEEGLFDIDWNFPVKIRNAGAVVKDRFTVQAGQYLGREDYVVQQVMICDPRGRFPGDEGCTTDVERP